jgi:deoxyribodipyrimidine photo-lyase
LIQVESDVIVPVETASVKEEYSAGTFRPKIHRIIDDYMIPVQANIPLVQSINLDHESVNLSDIDGIISNLKISNGNIHNVYYHGGENEAEKHLDSFIENKLDNYNEYRNDPNKNALSNLSPYLHFGQISPLEIALKTRNSQASSISIDALHEELIVRRELSMNFVFYNKHYDSYESLPEWAGKTLKDHENDIREYLYTPDQFENAKTHDPYWNAAQMEMVITGKMHGYMRMYWGKKILEWSKSPMEAYGTALYLNNKYELDGRDPNGFAGVAWCFGKHDRAWAERPVFGKIRYMNSNGLKRKFDADEYVQKINELKINY